MSVAANMKEADEKVSILIVDDRPDKLLSYEAMLDELKQDLVRANSGKEALRCLLQQDFAVILLDVNMPIMDGFETAALIRQRGRSETTPIIFISAVNDTDNHVSRGYSLGAVDYILTPVVPEILRAKIAVFVDLFKKTEQVKRQAEERARLVREQAARVDAEARQERLAFLADASNVLSSSLEYRETFQNLAYLIAPRLADFCLIHAVTADNGLRQVAAAYKDLGEEPRLRQFAHDFPASLAAERGSARVVETGKSSMFCDMEEETLATLFDRAEDRHLLRSFQLTSFVAVPIRARDRILGAITLVNITADRACGSDELSLAEALAERAALALDNAGLYKAAQKARTEAERANLAKDQFLAMLSHELRTPLTPVLTSVLSLENEPNLPPNVRESLQMIHRNVQLEARLIDDLLDLTRISKGKVQLSLEIVDAHVLLRNAIEICQEEINHKHLGLHVDLAAKNVRLKADPARLQQIFWNLIKNAVKFTPDGGRLSVRTSDSAQQLSLEVQDSGIGIDPESLPKIFDAFEQGERARFGGLGLGLAITKALVETHKGIITADSAGRNQGAKFAVLLPISTEATVPAPAKSTITAQRHTRRILLVEDHEDTNRSLTNLLRRRGYHVQPAMSVKSALDLAATEQFDVLISDIGLPDGTGIDLMRTLHAERPLFSIALTGYGMEEDIRKSHAGGFDHHLVKPIDLNKLDVLIQASATESQQNGGAVAAG